MTKTGGWGGLWVEVPAPRRDWAHGVWEALAITLAEPLRRAFDQHLAEHGCGTEGMPLDQCPEAVELWHLLPDGDTIAFAAPQPPGTVVPTA